ncbi:MAG: diadenylate cyclase CdaA [Bacteroidota bacterium]
MIFAFNIGFLEIDLVDVLDILLFAFLLQQVYMLMRGSVAIKIFLGFLVLYLVYLVVNAADMELLSTVLGQFMGVGVLAVIILFQQEIRKFLLLLGRTHLFREGSIWENLKSMWSLSGGNKKSEIIPIIEAAKTLGGSNTGALIVISKNSELKFFAESGDRLDAIVSKRLLIAIFNKLSPLHDGAVIVYDNKIIAARCILPVTERDDLPAQFGLRHRAAVGMSENTDVLILVVSEETGQLTTVRNGEVSHNLSAQELRKKITDYLFENDKYESTGETVLKKAKEESKKEEKDLVKESPKKQEEKTADITS